MRPIEKTGPTLIRVADKKDLMPGQVLRVGDQSEIIFVCEGLGRYQAISGTCTHESFPLCDEYLVDRNIICPLHGSEFDLETGACLKPPAVRPLRKYQVIEIDDELYIDMQQGQQDQSDKSKSIST